MSEPPSASGADATGLAVQTTLFKGAVQLFPGGYSPLDNVTHSMDGTLTYRGVSFRNEVGEARVSADGRAAIETQVLKGDTVLVSVTGSRLLKDVSQPRQ